MGAQPDAAELTTGRVVRPGMYVASPADAFVERMEEEPDAYDQVVLATRALRRDPGCIEAHLLLAEHSRDGETRFRHLRAAVRTGDALWAPVARDMGRGMTWWGFAGTRPYMRAIQALGLAHLEAGETYAARQCFDRLMRMNPHDNQGIRYLARDLGAGAATPAMGM